MRNIFVLCACAGVVSSAAGQIASTSFEEPGTGGIYTDLGDPMVNHALVNNPGEAPVNFASVGGELGFSAFYTNTRNSNGLTDGDFVGVTDFAGTVGAYTNGLQGYQISDADGMMTVTLDTVTFAGPAWGVSVDYFVQSTGWELDDVARIWVEVDGGTEIDILNTAGFDIDDLGIEDMWITGAADLSGFTTATLNFELDSNSGSEAIFVDNVVFAVPTPGTIALSSMGLVMLGRRKR